MRVLVTRPREAARRTAAALEAAGHEAIVAPLMEIRQRDLPVGAGGAAALAFTSGEAVRAVAGQSELYDLPVYAVGRRTGDTAIEAGFRNVKVAEGSVESLLALIARDRPGLDGEILHLSGDKVRGDLSGELRAQGIPARRQIIYAAVEVTKLPEGARTVLSEGSLDAVMLFSPRSAKIFLRRLGEERLEKRLADLHLLVISDAVSGALEGGSAKSILIAKTPDLSAMIRLLDELNG